MFWNALRFPASRLRRGGLWGLCAAGTFALFMWLAPAVVGSRLVWPRLVAYLARDLDGQVSTGSVSLGWFSPVVIHDVTVESRQGERLAEVGAVRTDRWLLSLLLDRGDLGVVRLEQPRLSLTVRGGGSNWEDVLGQLLSRESGGAEVRGTIEIADGQIELLDEVPVRHGRLHSIEARFVLPEGEAQRGTAHLTRCLVQTPDHDGSCVAEAAWQLVNGEWQASAATQLENVSLTLCSYVARRLGFDWDVRGVATAAVSGQWQGTDQFSVDMRKLHVDALAVRMPALLGTDQLRFDTVDVQGHCGLDRGQWLVRGVRLVCDAGDVSAEGQLHWDPKSDDDAWRRVLTSVAHADLVLTGSLDLAALAATLPQTLRVREEAEIESGHVRFELTGRQAADQRRVAGSLEVSDLAARRGGQRFGWPEPVRLQIEAQQSTGPWQVGRLTCAAPFLTLDGAGTLNQGQLDFRCDLNRFTEELQQFVDLAELSAQGVLQARLRWDSDDLGQLSAQATGLIQDVRIAVGARGWSEPRLETKLSVECEVSGERLTGVRSARAEFVSGADRLDVKLLEPVTALSADTLWAVAGRATGQWSSWLARVRPLLPEGDWELEGPLEIELTARVGGGWVELEQATARSKPFRLQSTALVIEEPEIAVEGNGRWNWADGRTTVTQGTFQSASLAFRATDVAMPLGSPEARLSGDLSFRADLARWHASWRWPAWSDQWRMSGSAQGQLSVVQSESVTKARWSLDATGAELSRASVAASAPRAVPAAHAAPWKVVWSEPVLKFAGSGSYDAEADRVSFDRVDLTAAEALRVTAEGTINQVLDRCWVDVKGRATYDLAKCMERVQQRVPVQLQLVGEDTQSFWLRGPLRQTTSGSPPRSPAGGPPPRETLVPTELAGQCDLRWRSAELWGLRAGSGQLSAKLEAGVLHPGTVELRLNQGTVRVAPQIHLLSPSPWLTADRGEVLQNVVITPEICERWLKYVAPLAAEATRAEGQLSMVLDHLAIPFDQPGNGQMQGTLQIQAARLGPGPLAVQLLFLAEQAKGVVQRRMVAPGSLTQASWMTLPPQETRFQLLDGRVHHDRLELHVGDVAVITRGSVGLDQSLSLLAQIPIRQEWVVGDARLARLGGHTVEIPVSGTFSSPRVDRQALEKLSAQMIQQAAGRVLENELNKGLQQLFGPNR